MRMQQLAPATRHSPLPPDFDTVARVVQRLAVLMDAGIAPVSAWRHIAAASPSPVVRDVVERGIVERGAVGRELAEHLLDARSLAPPAERAAWAALAAAWWVAVDAGAPLGPTLQRFAASLRSLAQSMRDVEVALAGPLATSRIVLALPAVGLLFGVLLGFDAPRILVTTPPGWTCLVIGGLLILGGVRWNRRLLHAARTTDTAPGLGLELLAIAVSLDRARAAVNTALREAGFATLGEEADAVLTFACAAGVPAAALLHAEAEELRRRARTDAQLRAAQLGTHLQLPLGVCILPAFVALGVVPIVIAILSSTVAQI